MFQHAAPAPHGGERRGKTPAIVAYPVSIPLLIDVSELAPAGAGRVSYYRELARVAARISLLVPEIHPWHLGIGPLVIDKQGRDLQSCSADCGTERRQNTQPQPG